MRMLFDVSPQEICDYAASYGWVMVPEASKDGLFVLNSPKRDFRQLVFPMDSGREEYEGMAHTAIQRLAEFLGKAASEVREEIREVNDDVISLRYYSESKIVNSISFEEALDAIEATRRMLLSAGSTVVSPKLFHPKLNRAEPQELIRRTRFRHTEEGSFILKVSCPVQVGEIAKSLVGFEEVKPFSRRAFEVVNRSSMLILKAIEEDALEQFSSSQMESGQPIVSYNLCDALMDLFDDERELPFELRFNWSRGHVKQLPFPRMPGKLIFSYGLKPKLEQLRNHFRPTTEEVIDTFLGTVEELKGTHVHELGRSGEVMLTLHVGSEKVAARVNLGVDHYKAAIKAHENIGTYIKVKGKLHPGKRVKVLDDIASFEFMNM